MLIVVQDLPVPYDRRSWLIARTLRDAGVVVSVICPQGLAHPASRERAERIEVYRYPMPFEARGIVGYLAEFSWAFVATLLGSLRVQLLGAGFDAIHGCNPPDTCWLLAWLWRPFGKRYLFDHHDLSPEMYQAKFGARARRSLHWALLKLERMSFATAHTTIASNESYREIAVTRGRMPANSVFVVRSGPDESRFEPGEPEPDLKEGRRHLCCYLGKMCEQDGVEHLLRTAAILTSSRGRDDILFVLIGEGPALPALRRLARDLGIEDHCRLPGFLGDAEVARFLSTADLGIDPDPKTAWADHSTMNKVMDYMYFGCPVVGFELTENRRSAGDAGRFVEPDSAEALADAIEELLADPELRSKMSEHGRRRVREQLLWRYSTPQLLAAYDHLFEPP